jgi:hypothetical protein
MTMNRSVLVLPHAGTCQSSRAMSAHRSRAEHEKDCKYPVKEVYIAICKALFIIFAYIHQTRRKNGGFVSNLKHRPNG